MLHVRSALNAALDSLQKIWDGVSISKKMDAIFDALSKGLMLHPWRHENTLYFYCAVGDKGVASYR